MRFAFKTANHHTTWEDILAVWSEADRIELFESGWLFDHFYPIWSPLNETPDPSEPCLEGWTMLAALAQATHRLRIGTLVTGIHYRNPAILAKMISTIDIISEGRIEIGIGAGWNQEESGAYGIELGTPRERSDRFEEACEVLVGLLTQPTTTFNGTYYQVNDARCEPKGPQRPHPPILIGGSGERRTLRTAAQFANHWNFGAGSTDEFCRKRDILHEHCSQIGRPPSEITLSTHVWLNSGSNEDLERAANEVVSFAEVGLDLAIIYLVPPFDPAVLTPLADALSSVN
jgi:F420-dependent oxidoreductase-like protein